MKPITYEASCLAQAKKNVITIDATKKNDSKIFRDIGYGKGRHEKGKRSTNISLNISSSSNDNLNAVAKNRIVENLSSKASKLMSPNIAKNIDKNRKNL